MDVEVSMSNKLAIAETKPWDQRTSSKALAVVVVIVVGIIGFGSRGPDAGPGGVVSGFYSTPNDRTASASDFTEYVSGTTSTRIREAMANRPSGSYSVRSIGEVTNNTVPVQFTHDGQNLTASMKLAKSGRAWKLERPFASVRFSSDHEEVSFRFTSTQRTTLRLGRVYTFFPGVHTITPMGATSSSPAHWEPVDPTFSVLPGSVTTIDIEGRISAEAGQKITTLIQETLGQCLKSEGFSRSRCPNQAEVPPGAAFPAEVEWAITPVDAASRATLDPESSLEWPCYVIRGTLSYTYALREGGRGSAVLRGSQIKGCLRSANSITWRN